DRLGDELTDGGRVATGRERGHGGLATHEQEKLQRVLAGLAWTLPQLDVLGDQGASRDHLGARGPDDAVAVDRDTRDPLESAAGERGRGRAGVRRNRSGPAGRTGRLRPRSGPIGHSAAEADSGAATGQERGRRPGPRGAEPLDALVAANAVGARGGVAGAPP